MRRTLIAIIILAMAIAGFIWLKNSAPKTPAKPRLPPAVNVKTITVIKQSLSPEVQLYGRLDSPVVSKLTAAVEADIKMVHTREGEMVDAGKVLVSLDDTEAKIILQQRQADVDQIKAQIASEQAQLNNNRALLGIQQNLLALSKKAVERAQTLYDRKLGSQSLIDEALTNQQQQQLELQQLQFAITDQPLQIAALEATLQRAKALLNQAQVDLQRTLIRAPFVGRIADVQVAVGERVRSGEPLLRIYDPQQFELRALIPSRYMSAVQQAFNSNKPITGTANIDNQPYQFRLRQLAGEVQADSGGREGLFELTDNSELLALGNFVALQLKLPEQPNIISLPFSAIYGLDTVYRVTNGKLEAIPITKIGEKLTADGQQQLLIQGDAINNGDQIIITQLPNAITGMQVKPQ